MSEPWTEARPDDAVVWVDDDPEAAEDRAAGHLPDGLVTLRYLWDALRRHSRLWLATGLVGLVAGLAFPFVLPPPATATTSLLLTHRPGDDAAQAVATDVRLATTETVARRVIGRLGLKETPADLLKRYTVVASTDRIVEITADAPSDAEAVRLATSVATTFLAFRMEQVRAQQQPTARELTNLQHRVDTLKKQLRKKGESPDDSSKDAADLNRLTGQLDQVSQTVQQQEAAVALMSSSRTLDPASVVERSAVRTIGVDAFTGLAAGLVLGVGFVVARTLVSDRLWRRQAIADALGAPVAVSLGTVPVRWWQRWRESRGQRVVDAAVDRLRDDVRWTPTTTPALAVVAVDDVRVTARLVAELAASYAVEDKRVLVADLSPTAELAKRLGVDGTGVGTVVDDGSVAVYVPDFAAGPAEGGLGEDDAADDALRQAWDDADLVLTLTTLHPARGGDHLRTWAPHAVAVVTAGRSTATRIHGIAEMVRLAGVRLDHAVLLGQDRTDETVGRQPETDPDGMVAR